MGDDRMPKVMRKSMSFKSKDLDVFEFLCEKENISQYLIRLVRKDMKNDNLEETICKLIDERLKHNQTNRECFDINDMLKNCLS